MVKKLLLKSHMQSRYPRRYGQSRSMNQNINECRICYSSETTNYNQLISPCKCSGSMKYIHYECLFQYINMNNNLICNICNTLYIDSSPSVLRDDIQDRYIQEMDYLLRDETVGEKICAGICSIIFVIILRGIYKIYTML